MGKLYPFFAIFIDSTDGIEYTNIRFDASCGGTIARRGCVFLWEFADKYGLVWFVSAKEYGTIAHMVLPGRSSV